MKFKELVRPGAFAAILVVYLIFMLCEAFGLGSISPGRVGELQELLKWLGTGYIGSRGLEKVAAILKDGSKE